jgi:hypothetical protein
MADAEFTKKYGCYDQFNGARGEYRVYVVVRDTSFITTVQYLNEKDPITGFTKETERVMRFSTADEAWDFLLTTVNGGGWRHSDDWPVETPAVW